MQPKKKLSERDIITKYIIPNLQKSGWDTQNQLLEEYPFTAGRINVKGAVYSRGEQKYADMVLFYNNHKVAVIEAKSNKHSMRKGIQQALDYAKILDIPSVFSTNGDGFIQYDRSGTEEKIQQEIELEKFPSPETLWKRYCTYKDLKEEKAFVESAKYYHDTSGKSPRYYQEIAINRTIETVAKGQKRILLTMATGTGKTYTAFHIIWRLLETKKVRRVLFLADRNSLIDQTYLKDFKPFGDKMTKIANKKVSKAYSVYLAIYQGLMNYEDNKTDVFRQFSPDFFDMIIIDECHRGSAKADSAWREILNYFSGAIHLGLTATPKETKEVSNTHYFGKPIYTYSLKQGIDDGFLAPYKVVRVNLNVDKGWTPEQDKRDIKGDLVEQRTYNVIDYDRHLIIDERTNKVAKFVSDFLKKTNRFSKTIIFCADIDHAQRMREAIVNENEDLVRENHRYVIQITGDEKEGKRELGNFINPKSKYPVITTTSELMTTGVDAQTCKFIVIDSIINSMTKFKQVIGRGTRINIDYDKAFFTIIDFRNATQLFEDKDFDGDPVQIDDYTETETGGFEGGGDTGSGEKPTDPTGEPPTDGEISEPPTPPQPRYKIRVNGVDVSVVNERVQYYGKEGKLITESYKDYTKNAVTENYKSLNEFLKKWNTSERKIAIIEALEEEGVVLENLQEIIGKEYDAFDLICHIAYEQPPLTRQERANNVKKRNYFTKYNQQAQAVLNSILDKYADAGIKEVESGQVLKLNPISQYGTPTEIINLFGGIEDYKKAINELTNELYKIA